jgi:hypothetical protein
MMKRSKMTEHQLAAFHNPCRLAEETCNPAFIRLRMGHSLILSLNSGYE